MQQTISSQSKKMKQTIAQQGNKLKGKWRKIVTGNELKRIRDHIHELEVKPKQVMMKDKLAFTFSVLNIVACQYFLMSKRPDFWIWYALTMPLLMFSRFHIFKKIGFQYFMLDFCYFTLFCTFLNLFLFRGSEVFFKMCFVFSNGPLPFAILVWRNSLVFHDADRCTSVYLHIMPSMLSYSLRWTAGYYKDCAPLNRWDILVCCAGYLSWQLCYFLKTEIYDKEKLDTDPSLSTSLRHLAADKKNAFARACLSLVRAVGFFKPNEDFDSTSNRTKFVFMLFQFLYTLVTFTPTIIMFYSETFHLSYILFIFADSVYNGAGYYIEVFSRRYHLQFDGLQQQSPTPSSPSKPPTKSGSSGSLKRHGSNSSVTSLTNRVRRSGSNSSADTARYSPKNTQLLGRVSHGTLDELEELALVAEKEHES